MAWDTHNIDWKHYTTPILNACKCFLSVKKTWQQESQAISPLTLSQRQPTTCDYSPLRNVKANLLSFFANVTRLLSFPPQVFMVAIMFEPLLNQLLAIFAVYINKS